MTNRARTRTRALRAAPALVLLAAACSVPAPASSPTVEATAPPLPRITVGSGPSVELQLMSELYAQVLEASGYAVTRAAPSPDAAAALESLRDGEVDLAAAVVTELAAASGADPSADLDRLRALLDDDGLRLLQPSGAERALGVAMRREDADQAGIATVSGLVAAGGAVTWGLPGDCAALAECAALAAAYGLALDQLSVAPVPMCTAESGTALNDGVADASLVCTTQPEIERLNLLVLDDDRGALPVGTIAPVVRAEWLDAAPAEVDEVIDSISAAIDTDTLTSLGVQVALEERPVADVAREWLEDNGLI
jgi:osmoprotectant transport system substrate-binding protein